ncbi:glycoside hydrolase family 30 protein [Hymenobacter cellulosivorans]|uniref:Glycosyl hydrolase n=1 Tax=Hymenobacter cellulosivorans TaxID=2932249 RepID=A0ABY4FJT7_9BACT|nr:glycoside hydrolase family 30 protein [Hymenobacter cellulosivorans]UOQ54821.1 hypothetical protein MUN80_08695 [Hymenobacter cellulosivorans]
MFNKLLPSLLLTALSVSSALAQNATNPARNFKAYSVAGKKAQVYATVAGTDQRLAAGSSLSFQPSPQPLETQICVFVDPTKTFQTVLGIGGALTDAAAETYAKLSKDQQQEFMQAYYSPTKGIGYTLGRTTIASSDFSTAPYDYIADKDESLKTFSVKHDEQYRIPFIKQAIAAAGGKLTMYVAPWSPPAWMKDNSNRLKGGKLLPQYRQTWADHYVKFIKEYERQGIPIWGLSTQNEPMAVQTWESCVFSATEERDFIKEYLGPTLKKSGLGDRKLIAWDHNRDQVYQRASTILDDPKAAQYVWGVGYHWYETWTGSKMMFDNVQRVRETYPDKNLLLTEACIEKFDFNKVNDWALGEKYGMSMINDFNNGNVGWTDWNILLDEKGGPNHVKNYCYAPLIGDTRTGKLIYTNIYYYIGHFSKFIRPGAKRIVSSSNRDHLSSTAFINTDGKVAVVVMNDGDKAQDFQLWMQGQAAMASSQPHSIMTFVIN